VRIFPFLPLSTNDVEVEFCELRADGVLRSSGATSPLGEICR
jgi:hypothetical protein